MRVERKHIISALLGLGVAVLLIWGVKDEKLSYHKAQGKVFGTTYSITYEATKDLQDSIDATFEAFNASLSMFNPNSVLSAVNANRDTVTDAFFETMFAEAARVHALSNGAFDITVAPLVNYWGFGTKSNSPKDGLTGEAGLTAERSDSVSGLLEFVGFEKVRLEDHHVIKSDQRVQLDGGAVAKGQACDVIAAMLQQNGAHNYLVEIGGEIVCRGVNTKGEAWRIGITKPNITNDGAQEDYQEILKVNNLCMATSGNYRNYYYRNGERRSHTIDPRTGYPVQHSVLSATVVSSTCMRADALATACMVLGADEALQMMDRAEDAACYLIVAENDSLTTLTSPNWDKMITK